MLKMTESPCVGENPLPFEWCSPLQPCNPNLVGTNEVLECWYLGTLCFLHSSKLLELATQLHK